MDWAAQEFETVELGDKRLNNRLVKLARQLAAHPTASIPVARGRWGDTAAAYQAARQRALRLARDHQGARALHGAAHGRLASGAVQWNGFDVYFISN